MLQFLPWTTKGEYQLIHELSTTTEDSNASIEESHNKRFLVRKQILIDFHPYPKTLDNKYTTPGPSGGERENGNSFSNSEEFTPITL